MSYKLFLDDVRNPRDVKWAEMPLGPWVIVRNYDDFVKYITSNGLPEFVAFDHDLWLSVDGLRGGVCMPLERGSKLREVFLEGD